MQASVYKYFERFNFVVTNFTDQYSRKQKQLIAINPSSLSYKCLKCFAEQKENYDLKKLAYDLKKLTYEQIQKLKAQSQIA